MTWSVSGTSSRTERVFHVFLISPTISLQTVICIPHGPISRLEVDFKNMSEADDLLRRGISSSLVMRVSDRTPDGRNLIRLYSDFTSERPRF